MPTPTPPGRCAFVNSFIATAVLSACLASPALADNAPLTPAETAAGWTIAFDGKTSAGWKGYTGKGFPAKGWSIDEGTLHCAKGGGGGDIETTDEYEDFELALDFKCSPGANSGIMFRVVDGKDTPWRTGPEFQLLDDALHPDGKDPKHRVGSLYDLIAAPDDKPACKAGEWNSARIRLSGGLLQHFLNGKKVVEVRVDGDDWKAMIAKSKFKDMAGFGVQKKGHIALQDHGDEIWFKNIRVRDLKAKAPSEVSLFNGKDFEGWKWYCNDNGKSKLEDVFSAVDGQISDKGAPGGYIATTAQFANYVLRVSWRWDAPPAKMYNSGVLLRVQRPDDVWPKSIEAQLMAGNAGDFYSIGGFPMKGDPARSQGRHVAHTKGNERPQGEWNEYEIIVDGETITLNVNGEELNRATECQLVPGRIALQSEGGQIWFKDIRLAPIK